MTGLVSPSEELEERLTGSDADRFLALLEEHKRIVFKVAAVYGGSPADREDLAQEIVVQLWRSFGRYDPNFRFSTWMYRVALNVGISFRRSESRRSRHVEIAEEAVLDAVAAGADPGTDEEDVKLLWEFIGRLPELDRALVVLYLDGNPHPAIAEVLGISVSNVGTKLNRIKHRLRREFAEVDENGR